MWLATTGPTVRHDRVIAAATCTKSASVIVSTPLGDHVPVLNGGGGTVQGHTPNSCSSSPVEFILAGGGGGRGTITSEAAPAAPTSVTYQERARLDAVRDDGEAHRPERAHARHHDRSRARATDPRAHGTQQLR
jgi:hypothetical protein